MAEKIFAIAANRIEDNGTVSFRFMFQCGVPDDLIEDILDLSDNFGVLTLKEKPHNYVDPFRLAHGEPDAIGSDGVLRWGLHVFKSGQGPILDAGFNEDPGVEASLKESLLVDVPDCVLLTHVEAFERLKSVCKNAGIQLKSHRFDGTLATS